MYKWLCCHLASLQMNNVNDSAVYLVYRLYIAISAVYHYGLYIAIYIADFTWKLPKTVEIKAWFYWLNSNTPTHIQIGIFIADSASLEEKHDAWQFFITIGLSTMNKGRKMPIKYVISFCWSRWSFWINFLLFWCCF